MSRVRLLKGLGYKLAPVGLLNIDDTLERAFYEQQSLTENWSVLELIRQKKEAFFLRLAVSKDKDGVLVRRCPPLRYCAPLGLVACNRWVWR